MATFGDLFARLDPDPNVRGRQFEHIVKWWLLNDPVYCPQLEKVWLWDEWPGRWGADAGIDLVARTKDGDLWAVQAKAYAPTTTITKRDIDTFLSESARTQFAYRLLVATTNQIGRTALRTLEEGLPAGLKLASDLGKAQAVWPESPDDLRAPRPAPKDPYPHNQEAIDAVVDGFEDTNRGQLVMACGTGKTLIGLWVTERIEAQRTLVLLPSLSLLAQTLREWTANTRRPFTFLPVCSDETVRGEDHMVSHTAELGMPVTTDPTDIAVFLRKRSQPSVVFATYQSSPRIAEAFEQGRVPGFDLVIADEAHRVAGRVSSDFATVLDPDAIASHRRLFMTATPRYFTGRIRQEAKKEEFEVASMDDEATFGPVFHQLTFGEAIDRELLTDYQVVIVGIDDPTYQQYVERGRFVTRDGTEITDARTLAAHISLAKAMRDFDLRRTISFHSRVENARRFANDFSDVVSWMPQDEQPDGELVCDAVSGDMPSGQRDVRLDRLRHLDDAQRGLLSNARCLGEGVDVPALDGVAFIDPKGSLIDIIQAVGRAIRRAEDKTVGTIVLPVYLDDTTDPDTALDASVFKPIWNVLKALRAHDEQLAEQLDELRRQMGRQRSSEVRLPERIHVDLPVNVTAEFANAFEVRLVEQSTESWEFWHGLLQTYVEREGHAHVPAKQVIDGFALGRWVNKQRVAYKEGRLTPSRAARLCEVEGWTFDPFDEQWESGFNALRRYVAREGHAKVLRTHNEGGFALGQWVKVQRRTYLSGNLPADRIARLEALDRWSWERHEDVWMARYQLLQRHAEHAGTADIPQKHTQGDVPLGRWVAWQRHAHREDELSPDRIALLEALPGWTWDSLASRWEQSYAALKQYVDREGRTSMPRNHTENGVRLGVWVNEQRATYRKGALEPDRIARLEQIPGWSWDRFTEDWEAAFDLLQQYGRREGHTRVPQKHVEGAYRLGQWATVQRSSYRRGILSPERADRLTSLPGWVWNARDAAWEDAYEELVRYVNAHGDSLVRAQYRTEAGFRLGTWVSHQRSMQRSGVLPTVRVNRLEALPGWTWDALSARKAQRNP